MNLLDNYSVSNNYYTTIDTLKTELEDAKGNVTELDELKRVALNIESDLTREKIKKTFLSAELGRPINVHRWRKLEGSDPARWAQVQRLQALQNMLGQLQHGSEMFKYFGHPRQAR